MRDEFFGLELYIYISISAYMPSIICSAGSLNTIESDVNVC